VASGGGSGVVWGDYDGDGDQDLFVSVLAAANKLYQNNGGGNFAEIGSTAAVNDTDNSRGAAWSDYDGDGDLDLYVGTNSLNRLYRNGGNSNNSLTLDLAAAQGDAASIGTTVEVWIGGQGYRQIIDGGSGYLSQNSSKLFFGLGTATQADSVIVSWLAAPRQVLGVQAANQTLSIRKPLLPIAFLPLQGAKNAPRMTDIAAAFSRAMSPSTYAANIMAYGAFRGKVSGVFSTGPTPGLNPNANFKPGEEVEVTFKPGLRAQDGTGVVGQVWKFTAAVSSGTATFGLGRSFGSGSDNSRAVGIGDLEGDGDLDLLVGNTGSQANSIYRNDGSGHFSSFGAFGTGTDNTAALALGDLDGDGDLDVAVANGNGEQNKVYTNSGSGVLAGAGTNFGTGDNSNFNALVLGDIDADGDLDLAVGNETQQNVVYLNSGSASFVSMRNFGTGGDNTRALAIGDVNGDGLLDLVAGNAVQQNQIHFNEGGWFATSGKSFGPSNDNTFALVLGDVDGDGDLDLALGNWMQQNVVYLNNAGAFGATPKNFGPSNGDTQALVLGDVDGNGSLDLVTGNRNGQPNIVYLNRSALAQGPAPGGPPSGETAAPSEAKQIFRIGITGDGSTSVSALTLTLSDLSTPTGLSAADISALCVYQSADSLFDQADGTALVVQNAVNIGSATTLNFTSQVVPDGELRYYIVVVKVAAAPTDGHALRVGFAAGGLTTSEGGVGTAVAADDANKVTIDVVATKLVFVTQPINGIHLVPLSTQPVVQAQDANGLLDRGAGGVVMLTASAGALVNGAASMNAGVATFGILAVNGVGLAKTLTASSSISSIASATSSAINITKATAGIVIDRLQANYDSQPKSVRVTTVPSGVAHRVTYNGSTIVPVGPGVFEVAVVVTDVNFVGGNNAQLTIIGPGAPVAKLSASPTTGNVPLTVQFKASSTGEISGSSLQTGQNGEVVAISSAKSITYSKPGLYTATLTTNGPGGSSQQSVSIVVLGPPSISAISGPTAREDEVLTLDLTGKGGGSGSWSVSDTDAALIASAAVSGDVIRFTPVENQTGSDAVTITRTGATGLAVSQSVTLTWTPVDDPPLIVNLAATASAPEDQVIRVGGVAHIKDLDSDLAKFEWSASGFKPELVASAVGSNAGVVFTPVKDRFGQTPAKLTLRDPVSGLSLSQDIVLTWMPVNDPPAPPQIARPVDKAIAVPLATVLSWSGKDVDKDPLVFDVFLGLEGQSQSLVAQKQKENKFSAIGLEPGQKYLWKIVARDPSGATAETVARFTAEADRLPPRISMLSATPVDVGIRMVWETDERAGFALDYSSQPDDPAVPIEQGSIRDTVRVRAFEVALMQLQPATWYRFALRVKDRFGNESPAAQGRFRTLAAPDIVKPVIAPGSVVVNGITEEGAWIRWTTDELSTGTVTYAAENAVAAKLAQVVDGGDSATLSEPTLGRDHAIELVGLQAATNYRFIVEAVDASGNISAPVEDAFETAAGADIVAPEFTLGPGARAQVNTVDIGLEADEVVLAEVRYDLDDTPEDGRVASGGDPAERHQIALDGLEPGTVYSYQVEIVDVGGNSTFSDVLSFETRAAPDTTAPLVEGWRVVPSAERALLDFGFDELVTASVSWWPLADPSQIFFADIVESAQRHKLALGNLAAAAEYAYEVVATDEAGNRSLPIVDQFLTAAAPDTLAPVILNALVNAQRLESTVLLVSLDEVAILRGTLLLKALPEKVEVGGVVVGDSRTIGQAELLEKHRVPLTKLVPGAVYRVDYAATDPYGNRSVGEIEFKAPLRPDTEPPQLARLPSVLSVSEVGARLGVAYNEDVQLSVRYYPTADSTVAETRNFPQPQQRHAFELNGLQGGMEYTAVLDARDAANLANRQSLSFKTLAQRDTIPPVFTKRPWVEDAQLTSVRLSFALDEPAVASVRLTDAVDPNLIFDLSVVERAKEHVLEVTGLAPGAVYGYELTVADANRNRASVQGQLRTIDKVVTPRIVEGPTRQRIGAHRAWLKLATNVPVRIVVDYFLESTPGDVQSEKARGRGKKHVVQLTNLLADTTYGFSVVAIAGRSKLASEPVHGTFRTAKGPDIIAPKIQGAPAVTGIADTRAKIVWKTNEPADSRVAAEGPQGSVSFSDPTPTQGHEIELTNLQPDSKYSYSVISRDLAGNSSTSSSFSFTTLAAPDTLPPQFARKPIVRSVSHDNVVIAYSANEPSSSTVDIGTSAAYELGTRAIADQLLNHEVRLDGLEADVEYRFRVGLADALGNGPTYFPDIVVRTDATPDTTAPQILTGPFAPPPTESEAIVEWTTDEPATRAVRYWKKDNPGEVFFSEEGTLALTHSLVLSNLESGVFYEYIASSSDEARNGPVESGVGEFRTQSRPQQPTFTGGPVADADESSATVTWTTNVPSNSIVDIGESTNYGIHREQADLVQEHEVVIKNLDPGVQYHYKVTSVDLSGKVVSSDPSGLELHSRDLTVRTLGQADTQPPKLVANPTTVWTDRSVVVSWETDEASTSRIEWEDLKKGKTGFVEDNQLLLDHNLTLTGLKKRTLYAVRVVSEDAAGNQMVWEPTAASKVAAKRVYDRGLRTLASGKVAQPPGGAGTFVTDSFPDTRFPVITGGPRVREKNTESITIEWQTDELADSFVRFGLEEGALEEIVGAPQDVQLHSITLTNLTPGTSYFFRAESTDPSGNGATQSGISVATTAAGADLTPPRYVREPEVAATSDVQATLAWVGDEAASATIEYWSEGSEVLVRQVRQRLIEQQVSLTNLLPRTQYQVLIWLRDANSNETETPFALRFTTDAEPDLIAPRLLSEPVVSLLGDQSATIVWDTDELADSFVDFDSGPYLGQIIGDPTYTLQHMVRLTNLEPGVTYFFRAGSTDRAENGPVESPVSSFTTLSEPDVEPPATPRSVKAVAGPEAVLIEWEAVSAADLAGYAVYRENSQRKFVAVATGLSELSYLDEGLINGRNYRYKISALDAQTPTNESTLSAMVRATPSEGAVGAAPQIAALEQGAEVGKPIVMVSNAVPLNLAAELSYTVQVSTEQDFSTIVDRGGNISESPSGTTRWRLMRVLDPETLYWFRVRAFDGRFESSWSAAQELRPIDAIPATNSEDFDGDGLVGFRDFFLFANGYGSGDAVLDLDRGGEVGAEDFRRFKEHFAQVVPGKRLNTQRIGVAAGTRVEVEADAISAEQVVVRLKLDGVEDLSGYGFSLAADPPILRYVGRLDSALFGGQGASLELTHEGNTFAIGEHLRGRQAALDLSGGWQVALLFEIKGVPQNVELRVEEGFLGTGRGRLLRVEQAGSTRIVPQVYALYANYPNPFNPTTVIPLAIPELGRNKKPVSLTLFNVLGQVVRRWDLSRWQPGFHALVWDGQDDAGRAAASGVYLLRLQAGDFVQVRKALLLR